MSAQDVDARQAALIVALDEAVGGALQRNGLTLDGSPVTHTAMRAALVDGLGVLAREFGPRPEDEPHGGAPPVRELPTEPGAVVLVTEIGRTPLDRPEVALNDGSNPGSLAWVVPNSPGDELWHRSADITDWLPARVVRDDEKGPVAALRHILVDVQRTDISCLTKLQAVEFAAREALKPFRGDDS